jgi:HNH endonuclease
MTTYVSVALRKLVIQRAKSCCEYCLYPQAASLFSLEIEHIIAEKHRGQTTVDNLALACPNCNRLKGSDITSINPDTDLLTSLVHPRQQQWIDFLFICNGRYYSDDRRRAICSSRKRQLANVEILAW